MKKDGANSNCLLVKKAGLTLVAVFCFGLSAHAQDIRLPGNLGGLLRDLGAKNGTTTNNLAVNPSGPAGGGASNATSNGSASPDTAVSAAPASQLEGGDNRFSYFMTDVKGAKAEVDEYTSPKEKLYLVQTKFENYLWYSVSKKARTDWYKSTEMSAAQKQAMDTALDALGASAAQKLPLFQPEASKFAYGSSQEKAMLQSKITDLAELKVHKVGLRNADWVIIKNNYGIPLYRTKAGYVWVRGKKNDHLYCRVLQIDINQSYQGGGSYGSSQGKFDSSWLSGCP
jgi:hypothetical protein